MMNFALGVRHGSRFPTMFGSFNPRPDSLAAAQPQVQARSRLFLQKQKQQPHTKGTVSW